MPPFCQSAPQHRFTPFRSLLAGLVLLILPGGTAAEAPRHNDLDFAANRPELTNVVKGINPANPAEALPFMDYSALTHSLSCLVRAVRPQNCRVRISWETGEILGEAKSLRSPSDE